MREKKRILLFLLSLPISCVSQPTILPSATPYISPSPGGNSTIQPTSSPSSLPTIMSTVSPTPVISPSSIQPTPIPTAQPTVYPLPENTDYNRKIIYTSNFEGPSDFNLYSINQDGSENTKLTNIISTTDNPPPIIVITPDGSKVIYSDQGLYQIDTNGNNKTILDNSKTSFGLSLSRDGKYIVFSNTYLGIYNVDTGKVTKFDIKGNSPSISPDNKEIVFSIDLGTLMVPNIQLFKMNIDGTNIKQITNDDKNYTNPKFLPDGSKLIVQYSDEKIQKGGIYSIKPDGTNLKFITDKTDNVVISPDGKHLAYTTTVFDLNISDIDGSNSKKILDFNDRPYFVKNINWSPDSSKLVFNSNFQVNVVNIDGTGLKTLTDKRIDVPSKINPGVIDYIYGVYQITW